MRPSITRSDFIATPRQSKRLEERRRASPQQVHCAGLKIEIDAGVYQTAGDSELMAESVKITKHQNFLEIGCGSGVVSLAVAKRSKGGVGVDINPLAVENSQRNAKALGLENISFQLSNVFDAIEGRFDVVICNPPYSNHIVKDEVERMFWDPNDEMKNKFWKEVHNYLKPNGIVYFGWANFADIDIELPLRLAENNGFELRNTYTKPHTNNAFTFFVFELKLRE